MSLRKLKPIEERDPYAAAVLDAFDRIGSISPTLTEGEKHVLVHSLTGSGDGEVYRNYFAAERGHHDMPHLQRLLALGLMTKGRSYSEDHQGYYYHCTEAGAAAVGLHLPKD